ncbi:MAG: anti-sigma factor [Candidatus Omnitrophota bacterium]|nr:hypothetical protein [Candidatus Omnitrophota bacterium]
MKNKIEELIRQLYSKWRSSNLAQGSHPDENELACFMENRLSRGEELDFKKHIASCPECLRLLAAQMRINKIKEVKIPVDLKVWGRELIPEKQGNILELILLVKGQVLEMITASADVLWGKEFVPAPVLRSRSIKDFKDEITVFKHFLGVKVEMKIKNKGGELFDVHITVKKRKINKIKPGMRISLFKDTLELESYSTDSGSVAFEDVSIGKYRIEINVLQEKVVSVVLEIRK